MLAQAFCHLQYNMHVICQAWTHIHSLSPTSSHTNTHPASQSLVKDMLPPRQTSFYSKAVTASNWYLSYQHTALQPGNICLLFVSGLQCVILWYAFTGFMCLASFCEHVCVLWSDNSSVCIKALAGAESKSHPRHRNCSLFVGNQALGLLHVLPVGHEEPAHTVKS